jgi:hypothetical protein
VITFSFNGTDQKVAAAIRAKGPDIVDALRARMDAVTIALQGKIVTTKLSGQVLQHRSGKLAGSIRAIPATVSGSTIEGAVEGGGGPAFYGRFHEYGVDHSWEITATRAKALAFEIAGNLVFAKRVTHPGLQERSFMRSTLAESSNQITASFRDALLAALVSK